MRLSLLLLIAAIFSYTECQNSLDSEILKTTQSYETESDLSERLFDKKRSLKEFKNHVQKQDFDFKKDILFQIELMLLKKYYLEKINELKKTYHK